MGKPNWIGYDRKLAPARENGNHVNIPSSSEKDIKEKSNAVGSSRNLEKQMSGDGVEQIERLENPAKTKPSKRRRLKNHCMRWWCCYGLAGVIFLAIFLPIFFIYIIPAIAQLMVNKASLPIHEVSIMNPTPDSVELSLRASLKIPKPFKVRLEPLTLQLYRPETKPNIIPYVNFELAEQIVKGNTTIEVKNQKVTFANKTEFTLFLREAVMSENFKLAARGETTAHLGAIKAKVKLDKEIEMPGLNQLSGFSINSASVLLVPEEDGTNLLANVTIPNRSIVDFELGTQKLNLNGPNKLIIGGATLENVSVTRGNNTFSARGFVDLKTTLLNLNSILAFTAPALAQGNLMLGASGNSTVFNGEHIEYYEEILNNLELTGTVPIIQLLAESFSQFMQGGLGGIRNLTESLGLNLTNILEILQGNGVMEQLGMADLSKFLDL